MPPDLILPLLNLIPEFPGYKQLPATFYLYILLPCLCGQIQPQRHQLNQKMRLIQYICLVNFFQRHLLTQPVKKSLIY